MRINRGRRGARVVGLVAGVALVGGLAATGAPANAAGEQRARFIVVLEPGESPREVGRDMERRHGGRLGLVYEHALLGFSIEVPENAVPGMSRDRRIDYVERDQLFSATQTTPTGVQRVFAPGNGELDIDATDDVRVDADIAIIDSGIDASHPDLDVAAGGIDCTLGNWRKTTCQEGSSPDGNGHGTHVAGSAAALDNQLGVVGTAPGARLHGVKVLSDSGSGYTSWIIAGIDWVTRKADVIEVANMSLGCECASAAQDEAIASSVAAGVTYVVAAGNSSKDASTFSPANHPDVVTVSALADYDGAPGGGAAATCRTDLDDTLADFSNYGSTVEIAAPGVCITSTWPGGGYETISGTSMASPHVAGAAAVLASTRSTASKDDVLAIRALLTDAANTNLDWTEDRASDPQEPLLDMSSSTYTPKVLSADAGTGDTGTGGDGVLLSLQAEKRLAKNGTWADLSWTGGSAASVDVYRNGALITTTANDLHHSDKLPSRASGTYTYKLCDAGTTDCSNEASITV